MKTCSNCRASVPNAGTDPHGRTICCAHCLFNPLGCRCKYGEYGVAETYQDPDYPEFDASDDDNDSDDDWDEGWGWDDRRCWICNRLWDYCDCTFDDEEDDHISVVDDAKIEDADPLDIDPDYPF